MAQIMSLKSKIKNTSIVVYKKMIEGCAWSLSIFGNRQRLLTLNMFYENIETINQLSI